MVLLNKHGPDYRRKTRVLYKGLESSDFGGFPDKAAHCASFLKTCFIELL